MDKGKIMLTSYLVCKDSEKCYGCRACEQACPHKAIVMEENSEGFLYPNVMKDKCVSCGLCSKVCPYDSPSSSKVSQKIIAAQYKDTDILLKSSSGGIFSAVADFVLSNSGYVAGCIFSDTFKAIHVLTNNKELVEKMRGSKYVQSNLNDVYLKIQIRLNEGRLVLFTGTPCQVDGLRCFLKREYDNLITVDLICHGVPSQKLLDNYLESVSKQNGEILDIRFRDKELNGWSSQGSITFSNKTKKISPFNNSYYNYYYIQNNVSRKCCYSCNYSGNKRTGDLTIGDYWNISEEFPKLDTSLGFSAVLINTEKGRKIIDDISDKLVIFNSSFESVVKGNGNLRSPVKMPESRKVVYSLISEQGYDSVANKYCKFQYIRPFIRRHIPPKIKKLLKNSKIVRYLS